MSLGRLAGMVVIHIIVSYYVYRGDVEMRTNIVIDDELVEEAKLLTGVKTKKEVVDLALRDLVARKKRKGILGLEGRMGWEGDLAKLRRGRVDTR